MHPRLPLLLLVLAACKGQPDALLDVQVVAASLEDVTMGTGAIIGGFVSGSGTLVVTDISGAIYAYPVELRGGTVGALLELDVDGPGKANRTDLILPEPVMLGNDLLGRYTGSSVSLTIGLGIDSLHLKNKQEVVLNKSFFSVGAGVHAGFEWVRIDVIGVETLVAEAPTDSGAPLTVERRRRGCGCSGRPIVVVLDGDDPDPTDTGDTGETGETGGAVDTGAGGADTDPSPDPDTDTDFSPSEAVDEAIPSETACASAPVHLPWWLALMLGPWVRRRRSP